MQGNKWYVITGGPSTGKTTLIDELNKRGYRTIPEAARMLIDIDINRGMTTQNTRSDEEKFQRGVAYAKQIIEQFSRPSDTIFFDRGMHDTLAYMMYYGYKIDLWLLELLKNSKYSKVFLLDPIGVFREDYARTEDEAFVKSLHNLLARAYSSYGMTPVRVAPGTVQERLEYILRFTETE